MCSLQKMNAKVMQAVVTGIQDLEKLESQGETEQHLYHFQHKLGAILQKHVKYYRLFHATWGRRPRMCWDLLFCRLKIQILCLPP